MLTVIEAAAMLGIKPVSVRYRCERGMFPGAVNPGRRVWMIPREEVEAAARIGRLHPGPKPTRPTAAPDENP
jgi:hypothetical protein